MPTAAQYRALLLSSRKEQLQATAENVQRLEATFDGAVASLCAKLANLPAEQLTEGGAIQSAYLSALLHDLNGVMAGLAADYGILLQAGMTQLAQQAAGREAQVGTLLGAAPDARLAADITRTLHLSDGAEASVSFGHLAQGAVERAALRIYGDGLNLSDRLYRLDAATRKTVGDTIVSGIAEQTSAKELARRLAESLQAAGADNPRYQAMRIARTEINTAHREAHIQSTLDPETGELKPYILAVGWRLSASHPQVCICDIWADDDGDGLGAGNYLPGNVPSSHPHCLCFTVSVLVDFPEVSLPGKAAQAEDLPESMARYYA